MLSYNTMETKARLNELLKLVEIGVEFQITRRGVPIARLVPINAKSQEQQPKKASA